MERRRIDEEFLHCSNRSRDCLIEEMKSVVATVSGYHGSERFKLIKLINQTGANYVGAMTKSTTHLVCWKFEGRKYNLAKEFGTVIVSHRWFEDCVKEGKRLPEGRYVMQSGVKAGPISWEPTVGSVRENALTTKNGNVLSDRYNICNDTMATQIDKGCTGTSSHLLSETLVPELRQETKKFHKNKKTVASSISKQDSRYSSKRCSIEKGFSGISTESTDQAPQLSKTTSNYVASSISKQDSGYSSKRCSIEKSLFGIGTDQDSGYNSKLCSIEKGFFGIGTDQDSRYSSKRCSLEKGFSGIGTDQDSGYSSKRCSIEKGFYGISSDQDSRYSSKRCFIEKGFSGIGTDQDEASSSHPTSDSGKQKRAVGSADRVEPTRKSRRLVKKNASRDIFVSLLSDEEQEPDPIKIHGQVDAIPAASNDSDDVRSDVASTMLACERECSPTQFCNHINITTASNNDSNVWRNEDALMPEGTSLQDGVHDGENRNVELEDIKDITRLNNMPASSGSNTSNDNLVCSQARNSPAGFCGFEENMDGVFKDIGESREPNRLPPSTELSCVICWTDFSPTRGILPCGHRFCYSCIQNWADHNASIRKPSTCPLCKTSFVSITKVDDAVSSDQKIYSQTIPCASSAATSNISLLSDWDFGAQFSVPSVCHVCRFREPEDLLVSCHMCRNRWVHSYCLDPPSIPWTCVTCRDLRSLYQRYR